MSQPERAENIRSTEQPQQVRWAGVDWSWSEHAVCVIDDDGAVIARFTVAHTKAGFATLVTTLDRHDVSGVATKRGDGPVVAALLEAGLTVFVIASRQVTALRTRYSVAGNKDDRFDAYLLADVLRTDRRRLTPLDTDTDATVGLRMLVRARADLVKARVAAHNQLRTHLQLAHPRALSGWFCELDGKVSLAFLTRFPTPRHARWLSEKRLAAWADQRRLHAGEHPHPDPAARAPEPRPAWAPQRSRGRRRRRRHPRARRAAAQPARAHHRPRDPHRDGPGHPRRSSGVHRPAPLRAGPRRDPARRDRRRPRPLPHRRRAGGHRRHLPFTRASGRARYVAFRRACNDRLRQALVDFADGSRAASPWAQDVYTRARARGLNHAHAVRVLARAWLRIISRCWVDRVPYDPARVVSLRWPAME